MNLFYTRKEDDLFVFADVKEKLPQEIFIKGAKAPEGVIALDENVELTYRTEQEGVYLNILKNESGFRMAGVRIPGGE